MTSTVDFAAIAKEVSTVDEAIMKVLPFATTLIGFIPGAQVAAPFLPLLGGLLQALDNAAKEVANGNPAAGATDILQEVINHLTPGQANSPILSGPGPITP